MYFFRKEINILTNDEMIGVQFGRWVVLDVVKKYKNGKTYCKCQCSCDQHTVKMIYKNSLLNGESQSCGCLCLELKRKRTGSNRVGERFGNLVVKEMLYRYKGEKTYCICQCDCGNETIAHIGNIRSGRTASCGCLEGKSLGERLIKDILIENEVDFIQQKRFDDCKHILTLPFDFYLPNYNTCIEFDGIQHFQPIEFFGGEDEFNRLKINDSIKTEYCKLNNINLIRLPYTLSNEEIKEQILNIWNP